MKLLNLLSGVIFSVLTWGTAISSASAQSASTADFNNWLQGFKAEAVAAGIDRSIVDNAFQGVTVNQRVFELNDNQPEFSKSIWDYLDSAVSETRIANGKKSRAENAQQLSKTEEKYGVNAEIIVAIWGLETAYGAVMGDHDVIQALATLAWTGRRTKFGRSQLIGALKIIQNGYASRGQLKGSWAGAMGHTQFIPTTYLSYAVDADGDGRRDIWSNLNDVFASTANYLSVSGFKKDERWGVEVKLPDNFNYTDATPKNRRAVAEWAAAGIMAARGNLIGSIDPNTRGAIIVPAGAKGPAFLVFDNFNAILKYNRSTSYALAVGLLSEHVAGRDGGLMQDWPRGDRALSLSERKALQRALAEQGFDPGPADGVIGANTKKALRDWQRANGYPADGYASADTLLKVTRKAS
ncbi:MAG: lytic murein transglycosylase [Pseudomonadota bacterium]